MYRILLRMTRLGMAIEQYMTEQATPPLNENKPRTDNVAAIDNTGLWRAGEFVSRDKFNFNI